MAIRKVKNWRAYPSGGSMTIVGTVNGVEVKIRHVKHLEHWPRLFRPRLMALDVMGFALAELV